MASYDAIVVPGGGLKPGGELPDWVVPRLDRAFELAVQAKYIIPLSGGTFHKPVSLDERGMPLFESAAAARYLIARGFPAGRILPETASFDTIGNAYFCRVIHTDVRGLRKLAVLTSEFHIRRTEAIFRWIFGAEPCATPYEIDFEATPDTGLPPEVLAERAGKERTGAEQVQELAERFTTLEAVHEWMYTEHRIYAPQAWSKPIPELTGRLADSY